MAAGWSSGGLGCAASAGNVIDYAAAVSGHLQLVPNAVALKVLEADYKKMADDGILLDNAEPFAKLIARCAEYNKAGRKRFSSDSRFWLSAASAKNIC